MRTITSALLLWLAAGLAQAQPFQPPTGYALESARQKDASNRPLLYGATSNDANWHITQWNAVADAPGFTRAGDGWSTSNGIDTMKIAGAPAGAVVLRQDGGAAPCSVSGRPAEFDLLIEPNVNADVYQSAVSAEFRNRNRFPTLDRLDALGVSGTYTLLTNRPAGGQGCAVRQGNASFNLILTNRSVQPFQIFWYNIHFSMICAPGGDDQRYAACHRQLSGAAPSWFWKGSMTGREDRQVANWGLDDSIASYGMPLIETPGVPHPIRIDLLAGIKRVIADGSDYGLDQDLSHWKLSAINLGQAAWGGVDFSTRWQGFVPTWRVRN